MNFRIISRFSFIVFFTVLSSCGFVGYNPHDYDRKIASHEIEKLVTQVDTSFYSEIEHKLFSLHCYNLIVQKNLIAFESEMRSKELADLYMGQSYLSLLAARGQIDEIESEISQAYSELSAKNTLQSREKINTIKELIFKFEKNTPHFSQIFNNLKFDLKIQNTKPEKDFTPIEINNEIENLLNKDEFRIYEKNVDHLSYMMELNIRSEAKKWRPSENENGSLSGEELPPKVWSISFSLGPDYFVTNKLIHILNEEKMKATFFFLGSQVEAKTNFNTSDLGNNIEIAAQSMTNVDLTKVGDITLEEEITKAKEVLEKKFKRKIEFYRLPYGSGQKVPQIRSLIAKNNLINISWNIDSLDWIPQTTERISKRTKAIMSKTKRDSGIILFHSVYPRTIEAFQRIIDTDGFKNKRTCHLSGIIRELNSNGRELCK